MPTLSDIMKELDKPGRDPRQIIEVWEFDDTITSIDDLKEGMILPGIVSNVTHFGAFVNIGIQQDGLIHVSQMGRKYVQNPLDVIKLRTCDGQGAECGYRKKQDSAPIGRRQLRQNNASDYHKNAACLKPYNIFRPG